MYKLACLNLSDFADISQVIIAVANLMLAAYIFLYQKQKDKQTERSTALLNEQNIKLQWFKELVVQPNLIVIDSFYSQLHSVRTKITSDNMDIEERENINAFIKDELSVFRKSFIDVLQQIDKSFADEVLKNVDGLVDGLTESIFNDELKLSLKSVGEKHITSKISYSRNSLIGLLYNYKGL